ncbi:hypothetical protein Hanom_Chr10g00907061 [Helianthus anomalus]
MNPLASAIEELLPAKIANSYWCFIILRIALVASSICVAFALPFFGLLMALMGSVLCILTIGLSVSITVVSTICMIVGTYSSLVDIVNSF